MMILEDQWTDKNINLKALSNCVVQFFKKRKFVTFEESSDENYHITVTPKHRFHDISEEIQVIISGQPTDFKVRFNAGSRSSELVRLGILTSLFGGGRLTLKGLRSHEAIEKLEKNFWNYVDRVIWGLANST